MRKHTKLLRTEHHAEGHLQSHVSASKRHESARRHDLEAERDAHLVLELEDALSALSAANDHYEHELQQRNSPFFGTHGSAIAAAGAAPLSERERDVESLAEEKKRFGFGKRPWRNAKPYLHFG